MSFISHSGYGYSKKLCEDVTSWFLNEFYPRHKISVDIVHRGLKRDDVVGYCDVVGPSYRPRHFLIELQTHMSKELYIKTLFHELTHLAQWVDGSLRFRHGKMRYCQEPVENYDYEDQPHEIEARENETILYDLYLNDKQGVPVKQVAQQSFPNRLITL
jgi:hypothetical protein